MSHINISRKSVVFMVGAGGSGKGFVIKNDPNLQGLKTVNSDNFIESNRHYLDGTKTAADLHEWASEQMEIEWDEKLEGDESFILDGTGKTRMNVEKRVAQAIAHGFEIVMIWVSVPLEVCLERNAKRERFVPEVVIADAWHKVAHNWDHYTAIANQSVVINNY
jgi:predicted kinase